ncbi:MAG: hypothetical protein J0I12_30435 [Candidatus Eremiobacteraeota bacterium]|nr:hypothetical protein [Candidatus Eremiobacteraeota bacterium]
MIRPALPPILGNPRLWQATGELAARASGVSDIGESFESYQQGDVVGGTTQLTSGASSLSSNVATLASLAGLKHLGNLPLMNLAAGAGGVGTIAQGLGDCYRGLTRGRSDLGFYGAAKIAAGGLAVAGACAGLPALSLVGGLSGTAIIAYQNRQEIMKGALEGWKTVASWVSRPADASATTDKPR